MQNSESIKRRFDCFLDDREQQKHTLYRHVALLGWICGGGGILIGLIGVSIWWLSRTDSVEGLIGSFLSVAGTFAFSVGVVIVTTIPLRNSILSQCLVSTLL